MCNNFYGPYSREFKTWWSKHGLVSFSKHWCGDHDLCAGFAWHTMCHKEAVPNGDLSIQTKAKIDIYESAFVGVKDTFQFALQALVSSRKLECKLYDACLYASTYCNESFFHSLQGMVSQTVGISHDFYVCRVGVTMLEFNWQTEWKVKGAGTVRKQKGGTTLARKQHLPVTTGPRLEIARRVLGTLFEEEGPDEFGMFSGWLSNMKDRLVSSKGRREKFIAKDAVKNANVIRAIRSIVPVKEDELVTETKGEFLEYITRAPFPFNHREEKVLSLEKQQTLVEIRHYARDMHKSLAEKAKRNESRPTDQNALGVLGMHEFDHEDVGNEDEEDVYSDTNSVEEEVTENETVT
jgi:hypothetical protein